MTPTIVPAAKVSEYCDVCGMYIPPFHVTPAIDECKCYYGGEVLSPPSSRSTPGSKMTPFDFLGAVWQHLHWIYLAVPIGFKMWWQALLRIDPSADPFEPSYGDSEDKRVQEFYNGPYPPARDEFSMSFSDVEWPRLRTVIMADDDKEVADLSDMY